MAGIEFEGVVVEDDEEGLVRIGLLLVTWLGQINSIESSIDYNEPLADIVKALTA